MNSVAFYQRCWLCWTGLSVWHPTSDSFSQLSSLHKAHSLRRKKRRNMLAIFGFRKNRNQTLSNQEVQSEAEVYGDGCYTVATAPTGFVYLQCDAPDNSKIFTILIPFFFYSILYLHYYRFLVLIRTVSRTEPHKYSDKYRFKSPSFLYWYEKWLLAARAQAAWYQSVYTDVDDSRWLQFCIHQSAKWLEMNTLHVKYRLG